jgi:hypothetical protein
MPDFTRSLAVVIGIDRYQNGIPVLQTAGNDARTLGRAGGSGHRRLDGAAAVITHLTRCSAARRGARAGVHEKLPI